MAKAKQASIKSIADMTKEERLKYVENLMSQTGKISSQDQQIVTELVKSNSPARHLANFERIQQSIKESLLEYMLGENDVIRIRMSEAVEHKIKEIQGDASNPIELMIAQNIVTCWLNLMYTENNLHRKDRTFKQDEYWDKALTAAQRRFLRACETLAKIRRLNLNIQVNIANDGGKQAIVQG